MEHIENGFIEQHIDGMPDVISFSRRFPRIIGSFLSIIIDFQYATGSVEQLPDDIPVVQLETAVLMSPCRMTILLQALILRLLLVMGAKTSEDVLMPDYESTARVSENTDNDHNLIDMALLERMGMCQVI
ncbi:hypothetical protein M0R45_015678 [Rubus argutus]|uniref:Uncharacterized protein n=1 Tax=Rubus argutus TaxID=59490 RepID=A0AAW1XSY6_RUBAR